MNVIHNKESIPPLWVPYCRVMSLRILSIQVTNARLADELDLFHCQAIVSLYYFLCLTRHWKSSVSDLSVFALCSEYSVAGSLHVHVAGSLHVHVAATCRLCDYHLQTIHDVFHLYMYVYTH